MNQTITSAERMKILKKLGKDKNPHVPKMVENQKQDRIVDRKSIYKARLLHNISLQQDSGLLKATAAQKAIAVIEKKYA